MSQTVVHMATSAKYPMPIIPVQAPENVNLLAKRVITRMMRGQPVSAIMFPIAAEAYVTAPKFPMAPDLIV